MLNSKAPPAGGSEIGSRREVDTPVHPTVEGPRGRRNEFAHLLLGSCDLYTVI